MSLGNPRFTRTPHLVDLIAEAERLAQLVTDAPGRDQLREPQLQAAAVATLRLDGSPLTAAPDVQPSAAPDGRAAESTGAGPGTWIDAMRSGTDADIDDEGMAEVHALEYLGARAGLESDDLAAALLTEPLEALAELHRRLTRGLVDEEAAGTPRRTEQAVHDASVGRIIYFPVEPAQVPRELHLVAGWLQSAASREHALVISGALQHELLRIHPFEAANGRLARTAARLVLRARGLDPGALIAGEVPLATDAIGYYDEVARTLRRRDLTIWLERWGEAVTAALRTVGHELRVLDAEVPARARDAVAGRDAFTLADYRAAAGVGSEQSRADLTALLDAGIVRRVAGSRGLRFEAG
jgi:hypothetical protein